MSESSTILVVEEDDAERNALALTLRLQSYDVLTAASPLRALEYIDQPVDLILCGLGMGAGSGLDVLRYWEDQRPNTPFVMITARADVESAVAAMKLGANECLTRPVDPERLLTLIRKCLEQRRTATPPAQGLPTAVLPHGSMPRIVGCSPAMRNVCDQIRRAAITESPVLILGESGTEADLIAESIHVNSPRRNNAFVPVNVAAIPGTQVESDLFGHVRDGFAGDAEGLGRFAAAHAGTIFIDEVGDLPGPAQAKLLWALENHTIAPLGCSADRAIDVRVVAATSRDLRQRVASGQFREDLFYRLSVVLIRLPPLRDRREDIPLLVDSILKQLRHAHRIPILVVNPELMRYFQQYSWPGNVRQLRNCLQRMAVMARGPLLSLVDLPQGFTDHAAAPAQKRRIERVFSRAHRLKDLQRDVILQTLEQHAGNRTRAAEALGISLRTLQRRLKQWNLLDHHTEVP